MRRRSAEFSGNLSHGKISDLSRRVAAPFRLIAEKIETDLAGGVVREWAWSRYGADSAKVKEQFPELWKRAHKINSVDSYSGIRYQLDFHFLSQNTERFNLASKEVQGMLTEEQKETSSKVKELRDKSEKLKGMLEHYLVEQVKPEGSPSWEAIMFWFADLKLWAPATIPQKRPRGGKPPSKELYDLVREAAILKDAVSS
jgi:hypothetical protein